MRKLPLALLLLPLALGLNATADTINLKDGTTIDGTITQQDANQVTVTYQVSESITDTRVIKIADIAKIEKTSEDTIAFGKLKEIKVDPWRSLSADSYSGTISTLKDFLAKYPQSTHAKDVQAILNIFQAELNHVQAGDVKLFGRWVPASEAAARASEVQEQDLYLKMQDSSTRGDLVGALNAFTQLEKNYPGSRLYPHAIADAEALQDKLSAYAANAAASLQVSDAKWKQGVDITPEPEKSEMIAARQNEIAQYDALIAGAQRSQLKWPPFIPASQHSIDAINTLIASEKTRMAGLLVDKMNASLAESDKAAEAVVAGDVTGANAHLKTATTLWPANEEAATLQKSLVGVKPTPTPTPAKPVPTRTPVPKVATAATATPAASAVPSRTPVGEAPDESSSGSGGTKQSIIDFFFTIPGAVTVVVCAIGLFGLASFLQKSKRAKEEAEDEEEQ